MGDLTKNISRYELVCKCKYNCKHDTTDWETIDKIQKLTDHFSVLYRVPVFIHISSAHRCRQHNADVGGADDSMHLYGRAVDFYLYHRMNGEVMVIPLKVVYDYLDRKYRRKFGIGLYKSFIHFDTRSTDPARKPGPYEKWKRI